MRWFFNILARFSLCIGVFICIGGMINSIFGTSLRFRSVHGPLELPTDFLTTAVATLILLLLSGIFCFLSNPRGVIRKMKNNIRNSSILFGLIILVVIFIVVYLPKLPYVQKSGPSLPSYTYPNNTETHNINARSKVLQTTPLMEAVRNQSIGVIETLIQKGADVNLRDSSYGMNSAMLAINFRQNGLTGVEKEEELLKIIQLMIEHGLDLTAKDGTFKETLLEMAEDKEYQTIVKYLSMTS